MTLRKLFPLFAAVFFTLAIYFFAKGNAALGAAMIAIASSQLAMFASLTAAAKKKAADVGEGQH